MPPTRKKAPKAVAAPLDAQAFLDSEALPRKSSNIAHSP